MSKTHSFLLEFSNLQNSFQALLSFDTFLAVCRALCCADGACLFLISKGTNCYWFFLQED